MHTHTHTRLNSIRQALALSALQLLASFPQILRQAWQASAIWVAAECVRVHAVNARRRPQFKARDATRLSKPTQKKRNVPRARGFALSALQSVPPSHPQWAPKAWYRGVSRNGIGGSWGGILGYPGVVSWGIRGYPRYPPTIRRIAVPQMTQITMAPVARKGILGGRSKCYIILEGAQRHFGAQRAHLRL